jgi:integrase
VRSGGLRFLPKLAKHFGQIRLGEISTKAIARGEKAVYPRAKLRTKIRQYWGPIKRFFKWCARQGFCESRIIDTPRPPKGHPPHILTIKEEARLISELADHAQAEAALADYIISKSKAPRTGNRHPSVVTIADVVSIYTDDVASSHARPQETAARLERLLDHFGHRTLAHLNSRTCKDYMNARGSHSAARRELEDLRAAVRHHWEAGLCSALTPVVLPNRSPPRERWLTRQEAARLLRAAWRLRQPQHGAITDRATAQHVARFILLALYTGSRAGVLCGAVLYRTEGKGWIDLESGVFYRRPAGRRETKKRQPPVRLPPRLLAHLRRWKRLKIAIHAAVEWNGEPVSRINKASRSVRRAAGLGSDVTPHCLRHTCATWLAQRGVPTWEAAGFLGMTVETFERVYGHHHPDHQQHAVNAFGTRQKPDRYKATKREQTTPSAVKVADNH